MPDPFVVLLDQNVPRAVADRLRALRPSWDVRHATEVGLAGKGDREVFEWAQSQRAVIITFDEDFADRRSFPVGEHHGVTLGTFTAQATSFAKSKSNLRLIDGDELVKLIFQHYDEFDSRYKGPLPLRRVYVPEAIDTEDE